MSFEENGFNILPNFEEIDFIRPLINVGALFDIPTGNYHFGMYGESILNGGVGLMTGIVGIGNNFKSTVMHYLMLVAASRFEFTKMVTYDTEMNITRGRLQRLAAFVGGHKLKDVVYNGVWQITDRTIYFANEWYEKLKDFMDTKVKNKKKFLRNTPFVSYDKKSFIQWMIPTFGQCDSFTEFETSDVGAMQNDNELGDSGANTIHMRQGLAKIRFMSDVLKRASQANMPMFLTAHVGKDIPMDPRAGPVKKLQFLKNGDKIKGATDKFNFLPTLVLQCQNAAPYTNKTTRAAEYPLDTADNHNEGDTDLNIVTVISLRNKSGPTGHVLPLLVSQRDGVLGSLSEFHYCKTDDRWGLEGNDQNYAMSLRPQAKLSRTTVRGKIDSDAKLRRAVNISAEMLEIKNFWHHIDEGLMCTPKQLYDDLNAMGYDWDVLLDTRGWWTLNNTDPTHKPFLSTMDLLRMRKGIYHPYWLANDNKTVIDITSKKYINEYNALMERLKSTKLVNLAENEKATEEEVVDFDLVEVE
jgi:hypothetical protein